MTKRELRNIVYALACGAGMEYDEECEMWTYTPQGPECLGRFLAGIRLYFRLSSDSFIFSVFNLGEFNTFDSTVEFLWKYRENLDLGNV